MFYRVTARLKRDTAPALLRKLRDGTIAHQKPDGQEIVDSMERATVNAMGRIDWSEVCYCDPPLDHERKTVLDDHFEILSIEPVYDYEEHEGRAFMDYLKAVVDEHGG